MGYHSSSKEEIFKQLATSEKGLTNEEAKKRLKTEGKNIIKKTRRLRPFKIFIEQFKSFLIYILIIAAAISLLIGNDIDAIVILVVVALNTSIGFFQQYRAEKAIQNLKKILVQTSTVIRDERYYEIPSEEIVPGDILVLETGDRINADCRILEAVNLQVNEAVLTGESMPVTKTSDTIKERLVLAERINMLYTGTQILSGSAKGVVVSTGMKSEFGKIASTLQEIEFQKTPMQKRMDVFSGQLSYIILSMVAFIVLLGVLEQFDKTEMFMTAIALAVSSIPEGLPAVLAISFAISSFFMSKKNVIIRKLPAIESLGSVTVICTDKTGTITEERMFVQELSLEGKSYLSKDKKIFYNGKALSKNDETKFHSLLKTGVLCNNAHFEKSGQTYSFLGDPTEESLLRIALDFGINKKKLTEAEPRIKEWEFNSHRKMMSILRDTGRNNTLYSKGATEKILEKCAFEKRASGIRKLSYERKRELLAEASRLEGKALRVLAFAYKTFPKKSQVREEGLIFQGFMGMIDPPRKEVKNAIQQCEKAGIKVKIITGDSAVTAKAIALQIGIGGTVISQQALVKMSDDKLRKSIDDIAIFARVTPEQKLRITRILQEKGETVAITGDGVNDVLALKSADVGIAMGKRGTDVARDVSDIVLIDDNFASLVEGVRQGRKSYENIKKFVKYFLSVNFSEIFLILSALVLRLPLPLLPLQLLWMNLITDSFPSITLVFEKGVDFRETKPNKEKSILSGIWKFIIFAGFINFLACFIVYFIGMSRGMEIEETRAMVLTTGILFELLFIYTCRSNKPLKDIGFFSNKLMNYAIVFSFILHLGLIYTALGRFFGVVPLSLIDWAFVIPLAASGLVIFEIAKKINPLAFNVKNGD